jgi:organic hydroperoxide reductase OsmC/OhrA
LQKNYQYQTTLTWTGNLGSGTFDYRSYSRNYRIDVPGKPSILGSSEMAFRGDPKRHNPEEMLIMALSSCHLLWYLHLCADNGIIVVEYEDRASGTLAEHADGSGKFTEVVLRPRVRIAANSQLERATQLHELAHHRCFIANSCNFPIRHEPEIIVDS